MMEASETGKGDDVAVLGRLFGAVLRRVLPQGEVHSVLVIPVAELLKQALGVPLVQHDQVVETFTAQRADHPLRKRVHPRGTYGGADFADAEGPDSRREGKPISSIPVTDEESRCGVPGEGVDDLLGEPLCRGVRGHVGEDEASAFQAEE